MKNIIISISLFVFWAIVTSVLVAGLVYYQDNKQTEQPSTVTKTTESKPAVTQTNTQSNTKPAETTPSKNTPPTTSTGTATNTNTLPETTTPPPIPSSTKITLSTNEVAKHSTKNDCWMIIDDKVYDITPYFGQHPGGSSTMTPSCGKDATAAYKTQDPYATTSGTRSNHSSKAYDLLNNYYIGDLNQTITI